MHSGDEAFIAGHQTGELQLLAHRRREAVDFRPDRRNCEAGLSGAHGPDIVRRRSVPQPVRLADLTHGAEFVEGVEGPEGVALGQERNRLPVG